MILQGEAIICVEDDRDYHLEAGSYLNIPAHTRHRVKWTSPETETIWLAIHYQDCRLLINSKGEQPCIPPHYALEGPGKVPWAGHRGGSVG